MAKKIYVLDSNILMQSPNAIFGFADNIVAITGTTLQELDKHKTDPGDRGYNTRETVRILDDIRGKGNLKKGVELYNDGILMVIPDMIYEAMPSEYSLSIADNRIISTVLAYSQTVKKTPVILITNDLSMRINATLCGCDVQGYKNETVEIDNVYSGKRDISLSCARINQLYDEKKLFVDEDVLSEINMNKNDFIENEFLHVTAIEDELKTAMFTC